MNSELQREIHETQLSINAIQTKINEEKLVLLPLVIKVLMEIISEAQDCIEEDFINDDFKKSIESANQAISSYNKIYEK